MPFIPTPLDLMFASTHSLADPEILALGDSIDWQAPQTTLVRYATSQPQGDLRFVLPVVCLLRSAPAHTRQLLLTPAAVPSGATQVTVPALRSLTDFPFDYWNQAITTALQNLDAPSFATLLTFLPPGETLTQLFRPQASPFATLGLTCDLASPATATRASQVFSHLEHFITQHYQDFFYLRCRPGRSHAKVKQFMLEMRSAVLDMSILKHHPALAKFWLEQGAPASPLSFLSAMLAEDFPSLQLVVNSLRSSSALPASSVYSVAQFIRDYPRMRRALRDITSLNSSPSAAFPLIQETAADLVRALTHLTQEASRASSPSISPTLSHLSAFVDDLCLAHASGSLSFPGFPGLNPHVITDLASRFLTPARFPEYLSATQGVPVTTGELVALFASDRFALGQARLAQTLALPSSPPSALALSLATALKRVVLTTGSSASPQLSVTTARLAGVVGWWPALSALCPSVTPRAFSRAWGLGPDLSTRFQLQVNSLQHPTGPDLPPPRL